ETRQAGEDLGWQAREALISPALSRRAQFLSAARDASNQERHGADRDRRRPINSTLLHARSSSLAAPFDLNISLACKLDCFGVRSCLLHKRRQIYRLRVDRNSRPRRCFHHHPITDQRDDSNAHILRLEDVYY